MNRRPLRLAASVGLVLLTLIGCLVVVAGLSLLLGFFEGFDSGTQSALEWGAGTLILVGFLSGVVWLGRRYYNGLGDDDAEG